ncbi:unknown [[Mannheimia] succiniciproducens MBEL55E]|uniref:Uncharacterized protein n=1 Tax=Mannheimia succiniciproducens (strain KCTC 0769BP / MBEL55E) TaxID=221988 RepID=Q65SA9_MANSM|nr:unknown [[Mannheimia] succiniciproducens MBEL55E]
MFFHNFHNVLGKGHFVHKISLKKNRTLHKKVRSIFR